MLGRSLGQFHLRQRGELSGTVREERFKIKRFEWLKLFFMK